MAIDTTVFSEYEVKLLNVLFTDDDGNVEVGSIKCTGSLAEESEVTTVTKKCRGKVKKQRTYGTGSGTLSFTGHVAYELYVKMLGMDEGELVDGVYAYGSETLHPTFTLTADVYDEDGVEKLKAWPVCTVSTGPSRSVENGAEEVAEIELEIAFAPDDYTYGVYEARVADLSSDIDSSTWLESFTPELAQVTSA